MCGIAGIYFKNPDDTYLERKEIEDLVDFLHLGIEHRGTHATGIAVQTVDGKTHLEKSDMTASKFIFWRRDVPENPRSIILHTRFHTKGSPSNLLNNHPVQYKNIVMTHNGHISNDDELFKAEELERFAEVDSEIISALLHKYGIVEPKKALEMMEGGFAIAALDSNHPGKLLLAKGTSSPLIYVETAGMWIWASEQKVLEDALEAAINYESKSFEFQTMKYGEYLLIDGDEHKRVDFQPAYKKYVPLTTSAYSTGYYGGRVINPSSTDDQCDECFRYFSHWSLNKIGNNYYCDQCEGKLFDITTNGTRIVKANVKKLSRKERKRLRKEAQRKFREESAKAEEKEEKKLTAPKGINLVDISDMEIGDVLDEEHWFCCEMVAEFFGTKKEFVDMILFSDDLVAEDDPMLATIYVEFEEKYQEILSDVRDDTDIVLNKISDSSKKARRFPVGF